ncbi:hypothetical protein ACVOMV_36455 [Mesorhizobium atlanticum]
MARRDQHILLRDPLADALGRPEPDKRSKAEQAEARAAMRLEEQRRRVADAARFEAGRKVAEAAAVAKVEPEADRTVPAPRCTGRISDLFD